MAGPGNMRVSRRQLIVQAGTAAASVGIPALSSSAYGRILGANDRVNVAIVGARSRGRALMKGFAKLGAGVTHICDVDARVYDEVVGDLADAATARPKREEDVRRVFEDRRVDAVVLATPDHWHAPGALMALQAGKHVYVEKPLSHSPREGEILIEAQAKAKTILQVGNQQRSAPETLELIALIRAGALGDVYEAYTWYANKRGSIGRGRETAPPDWLNWDLWQGPSPRRAFRDNYVHYNWHWFWHWGTGETCNNAMHELDVARWALDVGHPTHVSASGGRYFFRNDDWEMYDTLHLRLDYAGGRRIIWEGHSCNALPRFGETRGALIRGDKSAAIVTREGFKILDLDGKTVLQRTRPAASANTQDLVGADALTDIHIEKFIAAVRGVGPTMSDVSDGHISTTMCHLGNIAYRTNAALQIDPATGRPQSAEAMRLWARDYADGWEMKA